MKFERRLQRTEEAYWKFSMAGNALASEKQVIGLSDTYYQQPEYFIKDQTSSTTPQKPP